MSDSRAVPFYHPFYHFCMACTYWLGSETNSLIHNLVTCTTTIIKSLLLGLCHYAHATCDGSRDRVDTHLRLLEIRRRPWGNYSLVPEEWHCDEKVCPCRLICRCILPLQILTHKSAKKVQLAAPTATKGLQCHVQAHVFWLPFIASRNWLHWRCSRKSTPNHLQHLPTEMRGNCVGQVRQQVRATTQYLTEMGDFKLEALVYSCVDLKESTTGKQSCKSDSWSFNSLTIGMGTTCFRQAASLLGPLGHPV